MSEPEIESFLASNDTGVLSLGSEDRGYGFPISYTYDDDRLVLGFVAPPGSKKEEFAAATEEATFTAFTYADVDAWKSVIVTGTIHPVDEDNPPLRVPDLFFRQEGDGDTGGSEMVDLDQFERTWYELRIETLSGRHSGA